VCVSSASSIQAAVLRDDGLTREVMLHELLASTTL